MTAQILDRHLHIKAIDAFIDPSVPRERAIITHGHADHARNGHGAVLATPDTIAIMKVRYGEDCAGRFEPLGFGVPLQIDDVTITLVPAGHVLGSAQVLVEHKGQRVVVTGDYKRLAEAVDAIARHGHVVVLGGEAAITSANEKRPGLLDVTRVM